MNTCDLPIQHARRYVSSAQLHSAYRAPAVKFPVRRTRNAARNLGCKFEARVLKSLKLEYPTLETQPHFRFELSGKSPESCFPDALLRLGPAHLLLVEVKLRHTYDGYAQLTRLYLPVVQHAYPRTKVSRLEICKSYDPTVKLPEQSRVFARSDLASWLVDTPEYGILVWGR